MIVEIRNRLRDLNNFKLKQKLLRLAIARLTRLAARHSSLNTDGLQPIPSLRQFSLLPRYLNSSNYHSMSSCVNWVTYAALSPGSNNSMSKARRVSQQMKMLFASNFIDWLLSNLLQPLAALLQL